MPRGRWPGREGFVRISGGLISLLIALSIILAMPMARSQTVSEDAWNAIRAGDQRALEAAMLKIGANASHPRHGPLIVFAAQERAYDMVRFLARARGIDIDKANRVNETALMLVALQGEESLARQLIQRGAQVNRPGWTPLHYAATGGHVGMVKLLLEQHAFIDAQSPNLTTPVMMAARMRHPAVVRLLIEEGADPSPKNEAGLDAAAYLDRGGYPADAAWVRERAAAYVARYGTVQQPKAAAGVGDAAGSATPTAPPAPAASQVAEPAPRPGSGPGSDPRAVSVERPAATESRASRGASGRAIPEVVVPGAAPTGSPPRQP